ncbi:MAG: PLP-dependent aspartate aminotransferase family protein [Aeromonadales bacterium]|nr:PLP-dependent aspartate aminotransferase family protein [Aeromonadales bacterium]MDY2891796.1 PLP-dependent aspartate aminotransferase family protein [Succinivibrio sp.]
MAFAYKGFNTALIHGGIYGDPATRSVNVPIYQTSTYEQDNIGGTPKWEYSRTGNPTRAALEALIAQLEGGDRGFAFGSGMAAITAVLSLFKTGDKILTSSNIYGGTFRVLDKVFSHFGISYENVDTSDPEAVERAITPEVKALFVESPANPLLTITDLEQAAAIAHRHGLLAITDNTFMTPYLQRPLDFGFDIVVHSATKYLGGHSDLVAGLVVTRGKDLGDRIAFIQNSTGGVLGPFDSFLLIRGIKTLSVRLDRHVENAEKIAQFLKASPDVARIYYPGLKDFPGYDVNRRQARNGGAMMSFKLTPAHDIRKFFSSLRLIALAESLGGVESLVCHPATMTHAAIPYEIRQKVGITDTLIRLSTGIEDADDLIADLKQAIEASRN